MVLIGITGKKFSGKDTIADYLVNRYLFEKVAFATPIKEVCKYLFNLSDEELHDPTKKEIKIPIWNLSPRQLFQKIGTDLFRNHFDPHFWITIFETKYLLNYNDKKNIVCCDVRFSNEAELIKKYGGMIIKINRSIENHDSHESENNEIPFDHEIENSSSKEDLYYQFDMFLSTTYPGLYICPTGL